MKISVLNILSLIGLLSFGIYSTGASATQYYKWVDAKGSTHYSKTPPPKNAKSKSKVTTYGWKKSVPTLPATADRQTQTEMAESAQPVVTAPANASQGKTGQAAPSASAPAMTEHDRQQREANEALHQARNEKAVL